MEDDCDNMFQNAKMNMKKNISKSNHKYMPNLQKELDICLDFYKGIDYFEAENIKAIKQLDNTIYTYINCYPFEMDEIRLSYYNVKESIGKSLTLLELQKVDFKNQINAVLKIMNAINQEPQFNNEVSGGLTNTIINMIKKNKANHYEGKVEILKDLQQQINSIITYLDIFKTSYSEKVNEVEDKKNMLESEGISELIYVKLLKRKTLPIYIERVEQSIAELEGLYSTIKANDEFYKKAIEDLEKFSNHNQKS